jgi:hypothetical protein
MLISRDGGRLTPRAGAAAAVALALAVAGCSADYVEQSQASVLLVVEAVNAGSPVLSDVRGSGENDATIVNCVTEVEVTVRAKNPTQLTSAVQDVRILRYDVVWRRSDGRGVEGADVPYRTSGNITITVSPGENVTFPIDLVRHQAKLVPPLSNITGLQVVTMFADITLTGEVISGEGVSGQGTAQVTFADYGTGTQTCEAGQ